MNLREAGRGEDDPGRFKDVKGMGWYVEDYNLAQVTVNLNNYHVTAVHELFEAVREEAAALKVAVTGSEIVGVVPLEAILMAADYYIEREGLFILDEDQKVRLAVERLGLNSVAPFDPREKIIEYIIAEERVEPLAGLPKTTDEEKAHRAVQLQLGLKKAIEVPLTVMRTADRAWAPLKGTARFGNIASKSDVEVGAKSLETGIWGAW